MISRTQSIAAVNGGWSMRAKERATYAAQEPVTTPAHERLLADAIKIFDLANHPGAGRVIAHGKTSIVAYRELVTKLPSETVTSFKAIDALYGKLGRAATDGFFSMPLRNHPFHARGKLASVLLANPAAVLSRPTISARRSQVASALGTANKTQPSTVSITRLAVAATPQKPDFSLLPPLVRVEASFLWKAAGDARTSKVERSAARTALDNLMRMHAKS